MKILDVPQSGSLAGSTSSRNRFGQYRRTRATPVQPRTDRQLVVRGWLIAASQAWRTFSAPVRAAWNDYGATTPRTDSLGQTVFLSGLQQFVGLAVANANITGTVSATVPSAPPIPAPVLGAVVLDQSVPTVSVACTSDADPDAFLVIEASPQLSAGVNFNGDFRFMGSFAWDTPVSPAVITSAYLAKFGSLTIGKKVFFRAYFVSAVAGLSGRSTTSGLVVA